MRRQDLAHILRAARDIAGDARVLVIGSQSILGTYDEDDLPALATASIEADIAFLDDPDRTKADAVEGSIGELSSFTRSTACMPRACTSRRPSTYPQAGVTV